MKFEVINGMGRVVMYTEDVRCIPTSDEISAMTLAGYRYKVDGKFVAKKSIDSIIGRVYSKSIVSEASIESKCKRKPTSKDLGTIKLF